MTLRPPDYIPPLEQVLRGLGRLLALLLEYVPPRRPGRFSVVVSQDEGSPGMSKLKLTVSLPPPTANDIAIYRLTHSINGGEPVVTDSTGEPIVIRGIEDGSTFRGSFVLVDSSNKHNPSEPSDVVELVVEDTFAPPKPGPFLVVASPDEDAVDPPSA